MHKKGRKICTCCRVSKAKFYLYHSTKITKARLGFDDRPEHPSVQINSSSPWLNSFFAPYLFAKIFKNHGIDYHNFFYNLRVGGGKKSLVGKHFDYTSEHFDYTSE